MLIKEKGATPEEKSELTTAITKQQKMISYHIFILISLSISFVLISQTKNALYYTLLFKYPKKYIDLCFKYERTRIEIFIKNLLKAIRNILSATLGAKKRWTNSDEISIKYICGDDCQSFLTDKDSSSDLSKLYTAASRDFLKEFMALIKKTGGQKDKEYRFSPIVASESSKFFGSGGADSKKSYPDLSAVNNIKLSGVNPSPLRGPALASGEGSSADILFCRPSLKISQKVAATSEPYTNYSRSRLDLQKEHQNIACQVYRTSNVVPSSSTFNINYLCCYSDTLKENMIPEGNEDEILLTDEKNNNNDSSNVSMTSNNSNHSVIGRERSLSKAKNGSHKQTTEIKRSITAIEKICNFANDTLAKRQQIKHCKSLYSIRSNCNQQICFDDIEDTTPTPIGFAKPIYIEDSSTRLSMMQTNDSNVITTEAIYGDDEIITCDIDFDSLKKKKEEKLFLNVARVKSPSTYDAYIRNQSQSLSSYSGNNGRNSIVLDGMSNRVLQKFSLNSNQLSSYKATPTDDLNSFGNGSSDKMATCQQACYRYPFKAATVLSTSSLSSLSCLGEEDTEAAPNLCFSRKQTNGRSICKKFVAFLLSLLTTTKGLFIRLYEVITQPNILFINKKLAKNYRKLKIITNCGLSSNDSFWKDISDVPNSSGIIKPIKNIEKKILLAVLRFIYKISVFINIERLYRTDGYGYDSLFNSCKVLKADEDSGEADYHTICKLLDKQTKKVKYGELYMFKAKYDTAVDPLRRQFFIPFSTFLELILIVTLTYLTNYVDGKLKHYNDYVYNLKNFYSETAVSPTERYIGLVSNFLILLFERWFKFQSKALLIFSTYLTLIKVCDYDSFRFQEN